MSKTDQYRFTRHAVERLFERGGKQMRHIPVAACYHTRRTAAERLFYASAKENKSFINDTLFMTYLHARYGYDRSYRVFLTSGLIFVAVIDDNASVIVTVLDQQEHRVNQLRHG